MEKYSILLVDDDPLIVNGTGNDLHRQGYQITTAGNGEEAIALMRESSFDLMITDLVMGKVDGIQVLQAAKELHPDIMVIILTGHGDTNSAIEALRLNADDYLLKPCDPEEMFFRIARCVEKIAFKREIKQAEEYIHTLTHQLIKAHESERQRISRYLHDQVAQELSALKIGCKMLIDHNATADQQTHSKLSEMSKTLDGCIKAVRDLSYDLRPPGLDELGLVRTISQYNEEFAQKAALQVDFSSAGLENLRLDYDTEINLYRIIQEALNNIYRHARATRVTVKLVASFPDVILRIEDDGCGFDVDSRLTDARAEKRMGIQSMRERVRLLQGHMKIESSPGGGARLLIRIPYRPIVEGVFETGLAASNS
jgi:signal transduction histidine kinase